MLLCSLGLPGSGAEWTDYIVSALAQVQFGKVDHLSPTEFSHVHAELMESQERVAIFASRLPSKGAIDSILRSRSPLLLTLREPLACLVNLISQGAGDLRPMLGTVTASCAVHLALIGTGHGLAIRADSGTVGNKEPVAAIAGYFGWILDDEIIAGVLARGTRLVSPARKAGGRDLSVQELALAERVLAGYARGLSGLPVREIEWPREIFVLGDAPTEVAVRPIDMTGRSRCLVGGPYMYLPAGAWTCELALAFDASAVGTPMLVQCYAAAVLATACFDVAEPGPMRVLLEIEITDPAVPVEFQVYNMKASFEGHLAFGGARLARRETIGGKYDGGSAAFSEGGVHPVSVEASGSQRSRTKSASTAPPHSRRGPPNHS